MTVVVDASVAVRWVIEEEGTEEALRLWDRWQESAEQVIAPPIFNSEVTNALYQGVRKGYLSRPDAIDGVHLLTSAVTIGEPTTLYTRALILAHDLGLGATYDALYLALAEHEVCELWTADQRLVGAVRDRFPLVRGLEEPG